MNEIEIELNDSARKYVYIPLPRDKRPFFPGYKVDFQIIIDGKILEAHVTSAHLGTPAGDPNAGGHIRGKFGPWYARHPEIKSGDILRIKALEPGKRYELSLVDKFINSSKDSAMSYTEQKAIADKIVKDVLDKFQNRS